MPSGAIAQPLSLQLKAVPKAVLASFAILIAVKLGVLLIFGPTSQPDTLGYRHYADAILTGHARYTMDIAIEGLLHLKVLRSPHAHARIKSIDRSKALLEMPKDYLLGIVPASDTGAIEMALWSLLGERGPKPRR